MKQVSLTKTKFNSLLLSATLTMIVTYLMLLSDTLIVGNVVGEKGIAAINIVTPLYSAANFIAGLIGMGTVYLYCRAMGEFQNEKACGFFTQSVVLALGSGMVMFLLMLALKNQYLDYMQISDLIREEVEAYWRYEQIAILLVPINYLMTEMVYCDGDELISLLSNVIMVVGNIVISIILGLKLGTAGVSLGTVIGMTLATLTLCLHFFRKTNTIHFRWHFSLRDILEMNRLSLADAVIYLCWSVLGILLNKLIIMRFGEAYLPVLTVILGVFEFSLLFDGIGEALSPLGEVYLGEKNYEGEASLLRHAMRVCLVEGVALMLLLLFAAPFISRLYDITSPELIPQCAQAVRIMAFYMPFAAIAYLLTSQYLLIRKITLAVLFAMSQSLLFSALFCVLLSRCFGLNGISLGLVLSPICTVVLFSVYILIHYGKKKFPWLLDKNEFPTLNHSFHLTEQGVMEMRSLAEDFLRRHSRDSKDVFHIMLLIEECGMATIAANDGKPVIAEYSLTLAEDGVQLILRDNGKVFDITDADTNIRDLSSYVVSSLMQSNQYRHYLTTVSFNRSELRVPYLGKYSNPSQSEDSI